MQTIVFVILCFNFIIMETYYSVIGYSAALRSAIMKFVIFLTFSTISNAIPTLKVNPLSDEFINIINSRQSTWLAGRNFEAQSLNDLRGLAGTLKNPNKTLPVKLHNIIGRDVLPEFFDSRVQWGECKSIRQIRDQASCGSCWAFGAVEAMTDRICIHSNGRKQVTVSAEDLTSCCGLMCGFGCYGGYPDSAWIYWTQSGIVSGGEYGSKKGCKPYSIAPCSQYSNTSSSPKPICGDVLTPMCASTCDVPYLSYQKELTFGESSYYVGSDEDQIRIEIMTNGPVEAAFNLYADFLSYISGVYQNIEGEQIGGHAVKILGWGRENDILYWLAANSWGADWGENGFFKILRGVNHVGIESEVLAGLPKL